MLKERLIHDLYEMFVRTMLIKDELTEKEKFEEYTKLVIRYVINTLEDTADEHAEKTIDLILPCMHYTLLKKIKAEGERENERL